MTLPIADMDLSQGVELVTQPSLTWYINKSTGQIQGMAEELTAVRQAVEIILHIKRFRWQIFQPYSGNELEGLIGLDSGYVALELQRRLKEALTVDDRILGIRDFCYTREGDSIHGMFTVNSVYGAFQTEVEVLIE